MTLARVVASTTYWDTVDTLELGGMDRRSARQVADDLEPAHLPLDSPVRAMLAWVGPRKDTP